MKRSLLIRLHELLVSKSKKPWACFETSGIGEGERVAFTISWNRAFIENLRAAGFQATTDEETVQLFFIATRMLPEEMAGDEDTVNPEATPRLTSEANILKR